MVLPTETFVPLRLPRARPQGVRDQRVLNLTIALDRVKLVLRQRGQCQNPPLRLLSDEEVTQHLWSGEASVARRLIRVGTPDGLLFRQGPHSKCQFAGSQRGICVLACHLPVPVAAVSGQGRTGLLHAPL